MSFRGLASAALATLALCACGLHIGEPPRAGQALKLTPESSGCLDRAPRIWSDYAGGGSSEAEVAGFWDCASRSLRLFVERTRGAKPGEYAPAELRGFLESYFVTRYRISDPLLAEGMEAKRALLGGKTSALTQEELARAQRLISLLKEETLKLRPYLPLTPKGLSDADPARVAGAIGVIKEAASRLGEALEKGGDAYELSHLDQLFSDRGNKGVRDGIALIDALKAAFFPANPGKIARGDWPMLLDDAGEAAALVTRFFRLEGAGADFSAPGSRLDWAAWIDDVVAWIGRAVDAHPDGTVPFEELDRIVTALAPAYETTVSRETLEASLRPLIQRVLGGREAGERGRDARGLTRGALARVTQAVERWSLGQEAIEKAFADLDERHGAKDSSPERGYARPELREAYLRLHDGAEFAGPGLAASALGEIWDLTLASPALFAGNDPEIAFDAGAWGRARSFHDLSTMNWARVVTDLVIDGYCSGSCQGATLPEFRKFYADFKEFGIELKQFDRNDAKAPDKRFSEANLFTYSANGDDLVDRREGTEFLALMLSAKRLSDRIHSTIAAACPNGPMDPWGYPTIETECYRKVFFARSDELWSRMPAMAAYYRNLTDPGRSARFRNDLEEAGRKVGISPAWMNSSDSNGFGMVSQYVEVLFERYDEDASGTLSYDEAMRAFPVFKGKLREIAAPYGLQTDSQLEALYTYLLSHGEEPGTIAYLAWRVTPSIFRRFEADRGQVLSVFAAIGRQNRLAHAH